MKKDHRNALLITTAAVFVIILLMAFVPRILRMLIIDEIALFTLPERTSTEAAEYTSSDDTPHNTKKHPKTEHSSSEAPESRTPAGTAGSASYPSESPADHEVHTLPAPTESSTSEQTESSSSSSEAASESISVPTETPEAETTEETAENTTEAHGASEPSEAETAQSSPTDSSEFSDNSGNLPYIGTWRFEYDLAPAQEAALKDRYNVSDVPENAVLLRVFALLSDDGSLKLVFTPEDAAAFKEALNKWYADAASNYAESGANTLQLAAFKSWAAYRKGLYSLLSTDMLAKFEVSWHVENSTLYLTDEGTIQAEISTKLNGRSLIITDFRVVNEEYRSTVSAMQETLGFKAPFVMTKE